MRTQIRNLFVGSAFALAASGCVNAIAEEAAAKDLTDVRQETQIWTTYALSPYLRSSDLKVSVRNGKAVLSGTVEEGISKDLAKQIAMGVSGIESVDNNIEIQSDYVPPKSSDARSFGEFVDDASINTAVKSKLLWSRYAEGLATNVDTKNGKVSLMGTADSAAAIELAGRLAKNTHGVKSVDNQLTVQKSKKSKKSKKKSEKVAKADKADPKQADKSTEIADAWITAKVKSTFMYSSNVDSSNISVTTEKGVVDLSGMVVSGAERALAIEMAQNLRGVKSVTSSDLNF